MPLDLWGDFGFAAGANKTANPYQDAQECINYYPELSPSRESKVAVSLLGRPGLIQLAAPTGAGINSGSLTTPQGFATGDGSTTVFATGDSNLSLEKVYVGDWQGTQLQYTTPRTNLAINNESTSGFNSGISNLTVGSDATSGPDGGPAVYGLERNITATHNIFTVAANSSVSVGDFFTFVIDFKLTPGYSNNENLLLLEFENIFLLNQLAYIDISLNRVISSSSSVSASFVGALSNGFSRFAFVVGPANINNATGPFIEVLLNDGATFRGDGVTKLYVRHDIKKTQTISSWIKNTTSSAITVTDYTISGGNTINFAIAPASGALISRQFFVTGNNPGQWPNPSNITNLPVRGFWVLPGYTQALAVIGNTCYLVKQLTQGTTTTPGTITISSVGTLSTFSGPVKMRDNNTSAGSSASVLIVDGQFGYTYGILTGAFAQINAAGFTAFSNPSTVAYIDGWWIVGCTGSQQFFTNSPIYTNTWNATFFSLKDGASDNLVAVMENKEELWLLGERTSEIWYNAGAANFAFQRLGGTLQQIGCKAPYSVARFKVGGEDSLIWYGRSERGENVIVRTQGFNASVVSTNAVSDAIATYNTTGDAIGYCYEEDGHSFYVLTFPSADKTWVYDASLPPELAWHQRLSYDPYTNSFHRERPNAFMNFAGMRIVGDYQNGAIYQMTRAAYTDGGWPILSRRRSPFIWNPQNRRRVHMTELQVEFSPGQGIPSGTGSDPKARLRISRDYGTTYGEPIWASIGKIGNYVNRCIWRKLGWTRGSVAEIEVIDPVNRDITGVTLRAFGE